MLGKNKKPELWRIKFRKKVINIERKLNTKMEINSYHSNNKKKPTSFHYLNLFMYLCGGFFLFVF